jgi:hypothetical protein
MPATDARNGARSPDVDVQLQHLQYAAVPEPDADAVVDPNWLSLRGDSGLPPVYLPPAMAGPHAGWLRVAALVLIAVFVAATAAGICLTYGPPNHLF